MKRQALIILIMSAVVFLFTAGSATANITNPDFSQGADGLDGWDYNELVSAGGAGSVLFLADSRDKELQDRIYDSFLSQVFTIDYGSETLSFSGTISNVADTGVFTATLDGLNFFTISSEDIPPGENYLDFTCSLDVSGLSGQQVKLVFNLNNDFLGDLDTNVLLHDLRISTNIPVIPGAVELAKQVIGAPYLGDGVTWGGKGYDYCSGQFIEPDKVKTTGYWYWNNNKCVNKGTNECHSCAGGNCEIGTDGAIGLDCSGLIYWSYNRAYFQSNPPGTTSRPFAYDGVSGQRSNYSINAPVSESDLHAGDLLFTEGHVMMYTGPFTYENKTYNVVHASYCRKQVVPATYDFATNKVITEGCPDIDITGYGRWREQTVDAMYTKCPVDLVVTDPDGFTVSKDTPEIPGLLYFSVYDIDENGRPDEMVTIPKRKVGTYLITVIPESNALPTDIYSLEITTGDGQTMVLAQDVQIADIPAEPYVFESKLNRADFDNDGDVDFYDYATFASRWMSADCHYPDWCEGKDLDYSGRVDFMDLSIFTDNWLWEKNPADLDIDGDVDFDDYAALANQWMAENCAEPAWCEGADINKSGSVDLYDLGKFVEYWLEGTTP